MSRGFIRDKLQLKILILYILDHLIQPVDLSQLTELVLCDGGVDYFSFSEALSELITSRHVCVEEELYSITDRGREHCRTCTSTVPYSVRTKCDRNTDKANAILRRSGQVQTAVIHREGEEYTVRMCLSDDKGPVLSMDVLSYSWERSYQVAANFRDHAEEIFNVVLSALTAEYDDT